jgi:hypothetical protein
MRTTINFQPSTAAALTDYLRGYQEVFGRRLSPSEFVDDAVREHLMRAVDRLPRPTESVEDMLLRRAAELRARIEAPSLPAGEVEALMREATALRSECESAFLRRGHVTSADLLEGYRRTSAAATAAYNAGAMRLNDGRYVFPVRGCIPNDACGEVVVRVHRSAVGYDRVVRNLLAPDAAANGVMPGGATPDREGWTAFQLIMEPRRNEASIRGLVEHLVYPLKVSWESP